MEEKNNKSFWKGVAIGTAACLAGGAIGFFAAGRLPGPSGIFGNMFAGEAAASESVAEDDDGIVVDQGMVDTLQLIEGYLDTYYLFDKTEEQGATDAIYKAFVDAMGDPYTCYYNATEYDSLLEEVSGSYCGIGALLVQDVETGEKSILRVFPGSPAEESGLLPDDIIVAVDDIDVTEMDITPMVALIKGEEGTDVTVHVLRPGEEEKVSCICTRRMIEVPTVDGEMLEDDIGYISLLEFDDVTQKQFKDKLSELEQEGAKGLIVDVRDNPGGLLDSVVAILDDLLPRKLILSVRDKDDRGEEIWTEDGVVTEIPMTILMNENSASAAEIFSGVLQECKDVRLVGTRTFGKGIVQNLYPLVNGGCLKITVSRYYLPSGTCIHGEGITPDVEVEFDGEVYEQEGRDTQLDQAVSVMKEILAGD